VVESIRHGVATSAISKGFHQYWSLHRFSATHFHSGSDGTLISCRKLPFRPISDLRHAGLGGCEVEAQSSCWRPVPRCNELPDSSRRKSIESFVVIIQLTMPVECFSLPKQTLAYRPNGKGTAPGRHLRGFGCGIFLTCCVGVRQWKAKGRVTTLRLSIASTGSQLGFWAGLQRSHQASRRRNKVPTGAEPTVPADCARRIREMNCASCRVLLTMPQYEAPLL